LDARTYSSHSHTHIHTRAHAPTRTHTRTDARAHLNVLQALPHNLVRARAKRRALREQCGHHAARQHPNFTACGQEGQDGDGGVVAAGGVSAGDGRGHLCVRDTFCHIEWVNSFEESGSDTGSDTGRVEGPALQVLVLSNELSNTAAHC